MFAKLLPFFATFIRFSSWSTPPGRKRNAVMCFSSHSPLGTGVQARNKVRKLQHAQNMNYSGHTFATRFVHSIMPKEYYFKEPENFHRVVDAVCKDARQCTDMGITYTGIKHWVAFIGCKGDAPFLVKVGRLNRSFYNLPKRPSSKKPSTGVCHLCSAGVPGIPFEDVGDNALHNITIGDTRPWEQTPGILCSTHEPSLPESFFRYDIWHCWHLGEGRNLVASGMALCLDLVVDSSIPAKLDQLYQDYVSFCRRAHLQIYVLQFSKEFFHLEPSDFPKGSWTKGNLTTSLVKWMRNFLQRNQCQIEPGSLVAGLAPRFLLASVLLAWCCCFFCFGPRKR